MPVYHALGQMPPKRHTIFDKPNGGYYYEQLFGTEGFHGVSSLLYHTHRPTEVKQINEIIDLSPRIAEQRSLFSRKLLGFDISPHDDFLQARTPLLVNSDIVIGVAAPKKSMAGYFYKNASADELLFIHR